MWCMGDWTTLSVKQSTVDHLKEAKPEDMSWNEYLYGVAEDGTIESVEAQGTPIDDALIEKLDRIEAAVKEATNAAQSVKLE